MNVLSRSRRISLAVVAMAAPLLWAAKEFSMPKVQPALSYPAHDHHGKENVAVGIDPYDTPEKTKIFTVDYRAHQLLPVLLIITNDSDEPVQLSEMKAQLVTADRSKLSPESEDGIYRRLSHPTASGTRSPLPFPTKKAKGGVGAKELSELQGALFKARAVEPRSSQAGFLVFDVSDVSTPLAGARFYLTGLRDGGGNELMYFEIPLDSYLEKSH
jgi:hypothetical protein